MIGERALGEGPLGELAYEPIRATVPPSVIEVASSRAVIAGAAFVNLLGNPRARREYLITMRPLRV